MRILAFASEFPPYRGGVATYAAEIARAAAQLGAQVDVVAPDYGSERSGTDAALPLRVIRYSGGAHRMKDLPRKIALVRRQLRFEDYDVVHAMDWPFFLPVALQARTCKRIYTVHGTDIFDMARWDRRLAIRLGRVFRGDYEVIANSQYTLKTFRSRFPAIPPQHTRLVLLGVGDHWLTPPMPSIAARSMLGLPHDKFVIVTTARVVTRKNQIGVLEAIGGLPLHLRQKICYLIVGPDNDAQYAAMLRAAASASAIDVRLLGVVDDEKLRRIYAAADLFCLIGRQVPNGPVEGFGLVYLEAGGQGLASLAGDTGGVGEVVLNRQTGLLVPSGDTPAATNALAELIENPDLLSHLCVGAKQRAQMLSWRLCAGQTYGLR